MSESVVPLATALDDGGQQLCIVEAVVANPARKEIHLKSQPYDEKKKRQHQEVHVGHFFICDKQPDVPRSSLCGWGLGTSLQHSSLVPRPHPARRLLTESDLHWGWFWVWGRDYSIVALI